MNKDVVKQLAAKLKNLRLERKLSIMEVCGTHTAAFFHTGVKDLFPDGLTLTDGPGCPVCVTANEYLDRAIEIGRVHNAILAAFGDMIRVPSSYSSLAESKAEGIDVRVVYSPLEAIAIAEANPARPVVFLSVGFETTAPAEAACVLEAKARGVSNFFILAGNKTTPPAVRALLDAQEVRIDGFIIPGHVSTIIGENPWSFIADEYGRAGVITGFAAGELLAGTLTLLDFIAQGKKEIANCYKTFVSPDGNRRAVEIINKVFEPADANWRGLGVIPKSGLSVRGEFAEFDAERVLPVTPPPVKEHVGCRCGDLLRGLISPPDCPLFDTACKPERPVGPCMVSSEGPCAAYYKYWRR